jgi:hypothetical protein
MRGTLAWLSTRSAIALHVATDRVSDQPANLGAENESGADAQISNFRHDDVMRVARSGTRKTSRECQARSLDQIK